MFRKVGGQLPGSVAHDFGRVLSLVYSVYHVIPPFSNFCRNKSLTSSGFSPSSLSASSLSVFILIVFVLLAWTFNLSFLA